MTLLLLSLMNTLLAAFIRAALHMKWCTEMQNPCIDYQTGPGKYVITVSKPQCVTRVYEVNVV